MTDKRAQATVELSRRPVRRPRGDAADSPPLGRRIFSPRNIASILLTLGLLYLVYRQVLGLNWSEVWTSVSGASVGLFALAFAVFYGSFPVRGLRWKTLLANVGYSGDYNRTDGRPMPSALGLTRIMYVAWFANCVTVARLGDAYRGYLLKREAGGFFVGTRPRPAAARAAGLLG